MFFDIFKIWPPGGAAPFVYFFVFARFDNVPHCFDDFFLFEMKDLHKANIFCENWDGVIFCLQINKVFVNKQKRVLFTGL